MKPTHEKLAEYRKKRHFQRTPEPQEGHATPHEQAIFVIQKHDASHLHYDFRLEDEGVLKSWAVPKGPSTNPRVKRLAIHVEDHPLDYATFEGVIPAGEYGGGTVMVWDYGIYENYSEKDGRQLSLSEAVQQGQVVVWLTGKKLRGGFALVRARDTA